MFKYSIQVSWSEEDGEHVAVVPELPDVSARSSTPDDAVRRVRESAEAYVQGAAAGGGMVPEPQVLSGYSGQIRVRMPRTLHQKLAWRSRIEGVSLNTLIVSLLAEGIGAREESAQAQQRGRRPRSSE